MSHALTEVDTYSGTVVVPDAGDARTAASVEVPFQSNTNRERYFRARAFGAVPSYHYAIPLVAHSLQNFAATTGGGPGSNAYGWAQGGSPASGDVVRIPIFVPGIGTPSHSPKLTSIEVSVRPANGHGALPANQWGCAVIRQGTSGGSAVLLAGPTFDAAGTTGAYEALRQITLTPNVVLTTSDAYYVYVAGEWGANSLPGLLVTRIGVIINPE